MGASPSTKTRFLILSDSHGSAVDLPTDESFDVVLHCGDLTEESKISEFQSAIQLLETIDAPLKLVIAGIHDFSLDSSKFEQKLVEAGLSPSDEVVVRQYGAPGTVRKIFDSAKETAGIHLLDQGNHLFTLRNGAQLKVFASPSTSSLHADWGFQYRTGERHPWEIARETDIVMTHGPPKGVLDFVTDTRQRAGCSQLFAAVARAQPRVHCFGHIHEGWGAKLVAWRETIGEEPSHFTDIDNEQSEAVETLAGLRPGKYDTGATKAEKAERLRLHTKRGYCVAGGAEKGKTLFVNAALEALNEEDPQQLPWVLEMDLPKCNV